MPFSLQAVLFDMDGLTVDTEPLWFDAEAQVADSLGVEWTEADMHYCVGGPVPKMARHIAEKAGVPDRWEVIAEQVVDQVAHLVRRGVNLMPGVGDLLEECAAAKVPLALVSGSPRKIVDAVVEQLGDLYQVIVSADDVAETKPSPEPYLTAAHALGVDIARCVAIEDSVTGMTSAERAGAFVVVVPTFEQVGEQAQRVVLSSLKGVTLDQVEQWLIQGR